MIEFDAKLSADDVVFLLHDDDVDRTSNGHGAAKAMNYAQIVQLDAGSWFTRRLLVRVCQGWSRWRRAASRTDLRQISRSSRAKGATWKPGESWRRKRRACGPNRTGAAVVIVFLRGARGRTRCRARPAARNALRRDSRTTGTRRRRRSRVCRCTRTTASSPSARRGDQGFGAADLAYTVNDPERARLFAHWGVDAICTDRIDIIGADFVE